MSKLNTLIAQSISTILESAADGPSAYSFSREQVRDLGLSELEELLVAAALSLRPDVELDQRVVQEVALFAKTSPAHRRRALREGLEVSVHPGFVRLQAN